mmetsp:Transcript_56053/g.62758  ORF Transcript_56053/g.62758 Transcript_56053/m.62758 type:complete len:212 (+) Transcript_56053:505-1140(+)
MKEESSKDKEKYKAVEDVEKGKQLIYQEATNIAITDDKNNNKDDTVASVAAAAQQQQQQQQHEVIVVGDNNIKNELIISDLDGLQGLEDDIFVPNTVGEEKKNKNDTMGFGRIIAAPLRQGFNSQSSSRSIHSGTSTTSSTPVGTTTTTGIGNRQRLPTDSSTTTKESTMIFEDGGGTRNRNHAMSRDGMYCVDWKWEYFGMDAVVKISWE